MSVVTNVILTWPEDLGAFKDVLEFWGGQEQLKLLNGNDQSYGGTKRLEHCVAVGAINGLDLHAFEEHLRSRVSWEEPEHVRLFICGQFDDAFREILPRIWHCRDCMGTGGYLGACPTCRGIGKEVRLRP